MPKVTPITEAAPGHLSAESRTLHRAIMRDYDLGDAAAQALLLQLCETLDQLRLCQAQVSADGIVQKGSRGQIRPHPLLREVAECRRAFLACARALNLDLSPV